MIDKICDKIMKRIRAKMPEIDDERAEVIRYGLELQIGELPKIFLLFALSLILGIFKYTLLLFICILPYKLFSGGIHLKTHLGCIIGTSTFYLGNILLSKLLVFPSLTIKILVASLVLIFSIIMITLYAPADTENVPILRKKVRRQKKIYSYISIICMFIIALVIHEQVISNMLIIGMLLQSICISKFTYKIFKAKFGYLEYIKSNENAI